jgi:hypothetical protein
MVFSLFCLKFWVNYKEKYEAEEVEKPVTSSLNICPEACCKKGGGGGLSNAYLSLPHHQIFPGFFI